MSEPAVLDGAAFDAIGSVLDDGVNQQWRVARRPEGNVCADDFAWTETPIPEPGPGEALLRVNYLGLAPVMRMYMLGMTNAGERRLEIGDVIHGRGVAQVVRSRHPDWREGELVQGQCGWQTYKVTSFSRQEKFFRMPPNGLPAALGSGVLGMTGLSAWAGLFPTGEPRQGDRMVLSGAAGGVGSIVSQIAANVVGCDVVGIAGGPDKCRFALDHGCSAVIDYKHEDVAAALDRLRPDGIDLYFDNVGGEILQACMERLRMRSRTVLCGSISEYTRATPFALPNYTRLRATDSRMTGFFVYNHLHRWEQVMGELAGWIKGGQLRPVQDVIDGFANMPRALAKLYEGRNVGVQCCSVRSEPEGWI